MVNMIKYKRTNKYCKACKLMSYKVGVSYYNQCCNGKTASMTDY